MSMTQFDVMRSKFSVGERFELAMIGEDPVFKLDSKEIGRRGTVIGIVPSRFHPCLSFAVLCDDDPESLFECSPEYMKRIDDRNEQVVMSALQGFIEKYERKQTYWTRRLNKGRQTIGCDSIQYFERRLEEVSEYLRMFEEAREAFAQKGKSV